jgi:3'5'-cyclic nucleotide phosphodiesterase
MSVNKLMSRIVAPSEFVVSPNNADGTTRLNDYFTPMLQFACAFAALIHDVDHSGVANPQVIQENPNLSALYKNRSIAEQNSFDLSFNLLMEDKYADLRSLLFASPADMAHFRQILVNTVLATEYVYIIGVFFFVAFSDQSINKINRMSHSLPFSSPPPQQYHG